MSISLVKLRNICWHKNSADGTFGYFFQLCPCLAVFHFIMILVGTKAHASIYDMKPKLISYSFYISGQNMKLLNSIFSPLIKRGRNWHFWRSGLNTGWLLVNAQTIFGNTSSCKLLSVHFLLMLILSFILNNRLKLPKQFF